MSKRTCNAAAAGLVTALFLSAAPAFAQNGPPGAEEACTGDAMNLCGNLISEGNHSKIKSCLIRNKRSLTPECARFFGGGSRHHRRHRAS